LSNTQVNRPLMGIYNNKSYENFKMIVKFYIGKCLDTIRKEACTNEANNILLTQIFIITAMIFDLLEQARNQQIILFLCTLYLIRYSSNISCPSVTFQLDFTSPYITTTTYPCDNQVIKFNYILYSYNGVGSSRLCLLHFTQLVTLRARPTKLSGGITTASINLGL